jgi:hypothetical protein
MMSAKLLIISFQLGVPVISFLRQLPIFISAACFVPMSASAYDVSLKPADNGKKLILISGEILEDETPQKFLKLVKSSGVDTVSFDSEGGNIMAALELGRAIRKAGLNTYQQKGRECASACSLLFVSGVQRSAEDKTIGVHQSWFDTDDGIDMEEAVSAVQELTADMLTYLIEMGVDPKLLQVSLTTPSDDMHYLSTKQMVDLKVITGEVDSASQVAAADTSDTNAQEASETETTEEEAEELIEDVVELTRTRVSEKQNIGVRATRGESSKRNVNVRATPRSD